MTCYRTIVADPPWEQPRGASFGDRGHAGVSTPPAVDGRSGPLPYSTMTIEELVSVPVKAMAEADAHLYLWATNRYVPFAYGVAEAWGFRPVTLLTWCKAPMGLGLGGTFVQTTEFCLFARRGREVRTERSDTTWWQWTRPNDASGPVHSAKPDAFIDLVEQVSPGPYLEMFARRARFGWDYWGDESLQTAKVEAFVPASQRVDAIELRGS